MADINLAGFLIVSDVTDINEGRSIDTIYCHIENNSPKYYAKKQVGSIAEIHFSDGLRYESDSMRTGSFFITGVNILGDIDGQNNTLTLPDNNKIKCKLSSDSDKKGIAVICSKFEVTGITGLDSGESVTYGDYTYTTDGTKITRSNGGVKYTLTGNSDTNLLTTDGWELADIPITTKNYDTDTLFLADGSKTEVENDSAARLDVVNNEKTLIVRNTITAGVVATGDTVTITAGTTDTVYTLADNTHVTAKGASFTTTNGVVSSASGTLTLTEASDSLTANGTVNVDASVLTSGKVTYLQGTALDKATITLGASKSLTITESTNGADTVYDASNKTLTGVDAGTVIATSGVSSTELASIATAGAGTFTVNGITFTSEAAATVTKVSETTAGNLTVDTAITTGGNDGKNYNVEGKLYKSVSAGVKLSSSGAVLGKDKSVTIDEHDAITNKGTGLLEVSSSGQINLAKGMNFTMGETTYTIASEISTGYVGTEAEPKSKEGYLVTVKVGDDTQNYILTEDELSAAKVTDESGTQGELWDMTDKNQCLLLPSIPITVNAASESASYNAAGFAVTGTGTAAQVTKKEDGSYTVAVTDKVLLGVEISGVTAALSDSGTGTTYKAPGGSFQLNGTCTLDSSGLLTFGKAGNSVTVGDCTYTLNKVKDKVSIDTKGQLTSLTDGEKVTVTKGDETIIYEVSGETLLLTKTSAGKTETITNLLAAGEKDGFIIDAGAMEAVNRATETSKSQNNTGLEVNTEGVDEVTDGMLLDRNGNATMSEDRAIATVTIQEDESLKYTAKADKGQDIKITNTSSKTWDITASNKRDTIEYAGSGEASISAGDGNDSISITGSGDVLVLGENGKNTIIHTGTGDATLKGGIGNDTIRSTHADDVIFGGGGNNTFIITNVETKVSDFTYGKDKAIVSSAAGTLDISKVNANTDGTISYSGTGGTGGSLDVSEQAYGDFYAVTLADADGRNKLNVGWLGERGGQIDARSQTDRLLLIGNQEGHIAFLGDQKFTDTLIGGQSKDTIIAGNGDSYLWSGAGNDLIESNNDASHTIFFLAGDGNDTVTGFTTYGEDNADTLDLLGQGVTKVKNTSQGVQLYHDKDKLTLQGNFTANTMIQWANGDSQGVAKIGKSGVNNQFSYDSDVTNYIGSSGTDTLSLGSNDDATEIWLDGSHGVSYDSVEILDASRLNSDAILAGGKGKNTIIGGAGDSSLWGGAGSASDTLKGGSGAEAFYYGLGEGNDVIMDSKADDTVMLYNLALSDIKGANIEAGKITITQQNGQHLTVNGQAATFTLSDGSTWVADHAAKTWSMKE